MRPTPKRKKRILSGHPRPIEVTDEQAKTLDTTRPDPSNPTPEVFVVRGKPRDYAQEAKDEAAYKRATKGGTKR